MHALSYITEKYKQLEGILVNKYGAQGASLGMYAQSLKGRLPEQILRKISEVKDLEIHCNTMCKKRTQRFRILIP